MIKLLLPITLFFTIVTQANELASPNPEQLANERGCQLGAEVKEIRDIDINGWKYVSNRSFIIPARPSKHYLLILDNKCPALRSSETIGFTSTGNRLRARLDAVVIRDRATALDQRCYISSIYEITRVKY